MTARSVAQSERYHLIVTIWSSPDSRAFGGAVWRAATGVLSATGDLVSVADMTGRSHEYLPLLDPSLAVVRSFSVTPGSASIQLPWNRSGTIPGAINWGNALGEVALIDETSNGTAVETWERRHVLLYGRTELNSWGDVNEFLSFTIAGIQVDDTGDFFPPGAECSSERFADVGVDDNSRCRAKNSNGLLIPFTYAQTGSKFLSPCIVVQDEVDAFVNPSGLVPRRVAISSRRPYYLTVAQFLQRDPEFSRWIGTNTDPEWQASIEAGTDDLGTPYWYVNGNFELVFGSGACTFTVGSALATIGESRGKCRVGYQVRPTGSSSSDWLVVLSVDGPTIELGDSDGNQVVYAGAALGTVSGRSIPIPPDQGDALWWMPELGGIAGGLDGGPLTHVVDVLVDWLRMCRLTVDIVWDDLWALRSKLNGIDVGWVCRSRGSPWAKVQQVLGVLPVRAYLDGSKLRFRWVGYPESYHDVVATIELTDNGPWHRLEGYKMAGGGEYPLARIRSNWSVFSQRYGGDLTVDGSMPFPKQINNTMPDLARAWTRRSPTGRAQALYAAWRDDNGLSGSASAPVASVDCDWLTVGHGTELAAQWLLYRAGERRKVLQLELDASWRWLRLGDVLRVTEDGGQEETAQMWRVEQMTIDGKGGLRAVLESVAG